MNASFQRQLCFLRPNYHSVSLAGIQAGREGGEREDRGESWGGRKRDGGTEREGRMDEG